MDASFTSGAQVTAGGFYALTVKRLGPLTNLSILSASPGAPQGPCPGTMFKDGNLDGTWESYGALAWANLYDMAMAVFVNVYGNAPFASAKKKPKRYAIGKKTVKTTKAGEVKLKVPVSKTARKAIAGKGKLKATMEVTFTPAGGGKATTKKKSITLKPKPPKKKR